MDIPHVGNLAQSPPRQADIQILLIQQVVQTHGHYWFGLGNQKRFKNDDGDKEIRYCAFFLNIDAYRYTFCNKAFEPLAFAFHFKLEAKVKQVCMVTH
jgi:hypothetical protein